MGTDFTFDAAETEILTTALTLGIENRQDDAEAFEDSAEDTAKETALIERLNAALTTGSPVTLTDAEIFDLCVILEGDWDGKDPETLLYARLREPLGGGPVKLPKRKSRTLERADFLTDIIIGATEGGIGYWSQVSNYRWWCRTLDGGTAEHPDGVPNAYVTVHEVGDNPDEPDNKIRDIGVEDIARALGLIRKGPISYLSEAARKEIIEADRENDAGEIDAGHYDCIVQIAMFGEVVYG